MSEEIKEVEEEVLEIGDKVTETFEQKFMSKGMKMPEETPKVVSEKEKGKKKNLFLKKMKFDSKKYRKENTLAGMCKKEINGAYLKGVGQLLGFTPSESLIDDYSNKEGIITLNDFVFYTVDYYDMLKAEPKNPGEVFMGLGVSTAVILYLLRKEIKQKQEKTNEEKEKEKTDFEEEHGIKEGE